MQSLPRFDVPGTGHPTAEMSVNGVNVVLNNPVASKSVGDPNAEFAQELPGFAPRRPFLVDEYPACPVDWYRSNGRRTSYFLPVRDNHGMWLDFNGNNKHPYHLAVVISIQGVNAVTAMACEDAQLEQYVDQCPKHKVEFGPHRHCTQCGYHWPKQNYIASTAVPRGSFWLDGWLVDKAMRQFIFTPNVLRSVAAHVKGESRAFAVGLSFFLSKNPRAYTPPEIPMAPSAPVVMAGIQQVHPGSQNRCSDTFNESGPMPVVYGAENWGTDDDSGGALSPNDLTLTTSDASDLDNDVPKQALYSMVAHKDVSVKKRIHIVTHSKTASGNVTGQPQFFSPTNTPSVALAANNNLTRTYQGPVTPIDTKKVEIGAGARIDQLVYPDPHGLDFWQDKPCGIICINYCLDQDCLRIIDAGKQELVVHREGALQAIPVGN